MAIRLGVKASEAWEDSPIEWPKMTIGGRPGSSICLSKKSTLCWIWSDSENNCNASHVQVLIAICTQSWSALTMTESHLKKKTALQLQARIPWETQTSETTPKRMPLRLILKPNKQSSVEVSLCWQGCPHAERLQVMSVTV